MERSRWASGARVPPTITARPGCPDMRRAAPRLLLLLAFASGCYRTHYENFSPANPNRAPLEATAYQPHVSSWQHFFVYGWIPEERFIDARKICGRAENVQAIETRRKFLEGLVGTFAGYYVINIYSPWDGGVVCKQDPQSLPPP